MTKFSYQKNLNRAFWNSLAIVLSATLVVIILVYSWITLQSTIGDKMTNFINGEQTDDAAYTDVTAENDTDMNDTDMAEKRQILESLANQEGETEIEDPDQPGQVTGSTNSSAGESTATQSSSASNEEVDQEKMNTLEELSEDDSSNSSSADNEEKMRILEELSE